MERVSEGGEFKKMQLNGVSRHFSLDGAPG
jgi:hypothetical protein